MNDFSNKLYTNTITNLSYPVKNLQSKMIEYNIRKMIITTGILKENKILNQYEIIFPQMQKC